MSVELDVKICRPALRIREIIDAITLTWSSLHIINGDLEIDVASLNLDQLIEHNCAPLDITINDSAAVRCDFYFVDGDPEDQESGLWAVIAIAVRNNESILLMTVTAAALAKAADSMVIDETNILSCGRVLSITKMHDIIAIVEGLSLTNASNALGSKFS